MPSMPNVVVDAGPMVAMFDTDDGFHDQAIQFIRSTPAQLATTLACVTEAMYLLNFSLRGQLSLVEWIRRGGVSLEGVTSDDMTRIGQLMGKYSDLPMDFADATLVTICERLDIQQIATYNSDFDIYRFKSRRRFINVLK